MTFRAWMRDEPPEFNPLLLEMLDTPGGILGRQYKTITLRLMLDSWYGNTHFLPCFEGYKMVKRVVEKSVAGRVDESVTLRIDRTTAR